LVGKVDVADEVGRATTNKAIPRSATTAMCIRLFIEISFLVETSGGFAVGCPR
jgi:hypothetical protein